MDRQLYNNSIKQRYLNSLANDTSRTTIEFLFGRLAQTEELLGKDMYEFTYRDFVMMFDRNKISAKATFMTDKSIIKNYIKWCTVNGYCEETLSEIDRLNISDLNAALKIRTEMFQSEDELFDCIDEILEDCDQSFRDIYLAFYGLYWYGLLNEEIYNLPAMSFSGNKIRISESDIIRVSDRYAEILNRYKSTREVIMFIGGREKAYEFFPSELLIKNIKISQASFEIDPNYHTQRRKKWDKVMAETKVTAQYYGKKLVPTSIQKSGNFYRAFLDEQNGKKISGKNICDYFREFTVIKPGESQPKQVTSMIGLCKFRDYTAWKNVFYN